MPIPRRTSAPPRAIARPSNAGFWLAQFAALVLAIGWAAPASRAAAADSSATTFIVASDVHFGITRGNFRGAANVDATVVNAAMLEQMNRLPGALLPTDGGVAAGTPIRAIAFLAITGDLTNRQELYPYHIQSAAASWKQFWHIYGEGMHLRDAAGQPAALYIVPGNHDVSNSVGAPSRLVPETDATTMSEIYNRMMHPAQPLTAATYRYADDKIYYSRDVAGLHLIFLTMWPDSPARAWMEADLRGVPADRPVILFAHDPPEVDARHFTNPAPGHGINSHDKFENVLTDIYKDGTASDGPTTLEQQDFANFLRAHPNIVGYFHGHNNWTEHYTWRGPAGDVALEVFRIDSPMKGKSAKDEAKLAFDVVSVDASARRLTVRECLWNAAPGEFRWGSSDTISLVPHVAAPHP